MSRQPTVDHDSVEPTTPPTEESPEAPASGAEGSDDRQFVDRRKGGDRRQRNIPVAVDRRRGERRTPEEEAAAEGRPVPERRRQVDPTTCERDYTADEVEFMRAMDDYKRDFARPFPTWSEVLEVVKSLGYRKVAEKTVIVLNRTKSTLDDV